MNNNRLAGISISIPAVHEAKNKLFTIASLVVDIIVFAILLSDALRPVPSTEGWFEALTSGKDWIQILTDDEILLPPLYSFIIWIIKKISSQLIFLRLIGIAVGMTLYRQTTLLVSELRHLPQRRCLRIDLATKIIAACMIIFVQVNSTYLIWYDFTVVLLLLQVYISGKLIKCLRKDNSSCRSNIAVGFLSALIILFKHSNGLVYSSAVIFAMILAYSFIPSKRMCALQIIMGFACGCLLIFLGISILSVLREDTKWLQSFLTSSAEAKGGFVRIFSFLSVAYKLLIDQSSRIDIFFLGLIQIGKIAIMSNIMDVKYQRLAIVIRWKRYCCVIPAIESILLIRLLDMKNSSPLAMAYLGYFVSIGISIVLCVILALVFWKKGIESTLILKEKIAADLAGVYGLLSILGLSAYLGNATSAGVGYNGMYILITIFISTITRA
jgi:hypothetical protein